MVRNGFADGGGAAADTGLLTETGAAAGTGVLAGTGGIEPATPRRPGQNWAFVTMGGDAS